jgi:PqqD family protein of HPr-rel-A system
LTDKPHPPCRHREGSDTCTSQRWQVAAAVSLQWQDFGDDWVIYDNGSGRTHRLDLLTANVLAALEEHPATLEALVAAVSIGAGIQPGQVGPPVTAALENLRLAGLVDHRAK